VPSQLVPFVGREAEVKALGVALDAAVDGGAGVVALAGDPGVGKSRLVDECLALARARGFLTLHAAASLLHADLHYGVVVEALRPVVHTVEAGARARLVEGLSDLGRLFDGLDLPAPAPLGDPGMERTRLFEAVCRLLDRLTRQQPSCSPSTTCSGRIQPRSPYSTTRYVAWSTAASWCSSHAVPVSPAENSTCCCRHCAGLVC
jgi:hypothetical protein